MLALWFFFFFKLVFFFLAEPCAPRLLPLSALRGALPANLSAGSAALGLRLSAEREAAEASPTPGGEETGPGRDVCAPPRLSPEPGLNGPGSRLPPR